MIVLVGVLAVAALAIAAIPARAEASRRRQAAATVRIVTALAATTLSVVLLVPAWQDSGELSLVLVGVPAVAGTTVLVLECTGRPVRAVTWIAGILVLFWSVLTALGLGLYYLGPGILLLAAAAVTPRDRVRTDA
ncbi:MULTISPECIES: hypothetical protein [Micrococcales]|uniref:hypothetical protein n=1 Tax=Micrococcales TaxID=85006 RepID=UPI0005CBE694|nr:MULTISPECIES: hypothetical protein [unclassified Micrococcus]MBM4624970.1 hypothetical protein [Micrococcus sp. JV4]RYC99117.1 hypothetical protein SJ20_11055 [Micrococcus sp. MS-ASIII-49]